MATMELATGRSDMTVCGGVDTFNDIFMYMCFSKTPALSPSGDARPFAAEGDGTVLGEGIGMVVLKRLEDAQRDGDDIYAVITGVGSSSDGKNNAIYAPNATGQAKALREAYELAGVTPDTIDLVEAHGTGTAVGDATELRSLTDVFRAAREDGVWCALGSVKSQIGHTKAAAGMAALIKAALSLRHKVLPPTIKVDQPLEPLAKRETPFFLNLLKRPWVKRRETPRRAAVSSFGFGGSNFHCVLEEAEPAKRSVDWDGDAQILSFSASDTAALAKQLDAFAERVERDGLVEDWGTLRTAAAAQRHTFDRDDHCRLLLVAERGVTDLPKQLTAASSMLAAHPDQASWSLPDGVWFGSGKADGKLGMLFPGQGSQYVDMMRDLACQFPQFHEALEEAEAAFQRAQGAKPDWAKETASWLHEYIFPQSVFEEETKRALELALRATEVAQPAIGAMSLASLMTLVHFGVQADAVAGHSYGELTALSAAGRVDHVELHDLSNARGRAMAEPAGPQLPPVATNGGAAQAGGHAGARDPGSMVAVLAPLARVEELITREKLDLVIANRNAPEQSVLSGRTAEVERAVQLFEAAGIRAKQLEVSAAFHSELVADARVPFARALDGAAMAPGRIPVFANTTAGEYPDDPAGARALLADQLANPVRFVEQIEAMYASGVTTFVEVGPGRRLTGLVRSILGDRAHICSAIDASQGRRSGIGDLGRLLAELSAAGHPVDLTQWDDAVVPESADAPPAKRSLTVPISGANHVDARPARPPREVPKMADTPSPAPQAPATPVVAQQQPVQSPPAASSAPAAATPAPVAPVAGPPVREAMAAIERIQLQTAQLHQQFLEGQLQVQRTLQGLITGQVPALPAPAPQALPAPAPIPAPAPAPAVQVPAPVPIAPAPEPTSVAAPAPQPAPAPPAPSNAGAVAGLLLTVIAEKTGYPAEMLELNMGLDADLGIDSIKRVEILSAIQEQMPELPLVKPEHLGQLQTLQDIVDFLSADSGTASPAPVALPVPAPAAEAAAGSGAVAALLLEIVAEKTGYPVDMLELEMGWGSTPTWASTPSSASRSSRPCKSASPTCPW
ncbi:MAG: acyltransferase domain-containing protein [Planctomycetota bacterium]|jgi:acyl transferase domain-containing protein/acyl carrier protein